MRKITFEISEEAYQLLLSIKKDGYAEYRNTRYANPKGKINKRIVLNSSDDEESNSYYLIGELQKYNLVENNMDSWYPTYILTDFGKEMVSKETIRDNIINKILE